MYMKSYSVGLTKEIYEALDKINEEMNWNSSLPHYLQGKISMRDTACEVLALGIKAWKANGGKVGQTPG